MLRQLLALLLLACVWSCAPEAALAQPNCIPLDVAVNRLSETSIVADVYVTSEAETVKAVEIINAMPPETDEHFDVIILVTTKSGTGAMFFGNDGQVCGHVEMADEMWRTVVRSVRGQGT